MKIWIWKVSEDFFKPFKFYYMVAIDDPHSLCASGFELEKVIELVVKEADKRGILTYEGRKLWFVHFRVPFDYVSTFDSLFGPKFNCNKTCLSLTDTEKEKCFDWLNIKSSEAYQDNRLKAKTAKKS